MKKLLLAAALLLISNNLFAQTVITSVPVTIAWNDPNTPPTNNYNIYVDNVRNGSSTTLTYIITTMTNGSHTITVTSFVTGGESLPSAPLNVSYSPVVIPQPPTNVRVTSTLLSIPPSKSITDTHGGVWTLNGTTVLINGSSANGGVGSQIWLANGNIYVLGSDNNWWLWIQAQSTYSNVGPTRPF